MPLREMRFGARSAVPYAFGVGVFLVILFGFVLRRKIWAAVQLAVVSASISGLPVHAGDLIFQTSRSAQSVAIQHATGSPYSHMGLILFREGQPYVLEASATVRSTPLASWVMRGEQHHFVVKRLLNADRILTPAAMDQVELVAASFVGHPYDLTLEWSDERI